MAIKDNVLHQSLVLDVNSTDSLNVIEMKQGDISSRFIDITLVASGAPIDVKTLVGDEGKAIFIASMNGELRQNEDVEINEDSSITVEVSENALGEAGLLACEIKLKDLDNSVLSSALFIVRVGRSAAGNEIYVIDVAEGVILEKHLASGSVSGDKIQEKAISKKHLAFEIDENTGLSEGSVTPDLLDRSYLERCVTEYGEEVTSFAELFEKVGRINRGGKLGFVKLNVSDSDTETVNTYGYISGDFLAVGTPTNSDVCLVNLRNGENWTASKNDDETYFAYKVDSLTPRVETLEQNAKITVLGELSSLSNLTSGSFSKDYLYHFYSTGTLVELVGEGYCSGRYSEEYSEAGELLNKYLEVFNSTTLKTWMLDFKEGTAQLLAQGKDEEALAKKINFVAINLPDGSNGDEELEGLDTNCIGTAGGGAGYPFMFESYTAPKGVYVVEGLNAHVVQYKKYLSGPDIHKKYMRMYAHDGVEAVWSDWQSADPEAESAQIIELGTFEASDIQSYAFEAGVLYKLDYYESDCLGVCEDIQGVNYLKYISLNSGKTGRINTATGEVEELGGGKGEDGVGIESIQQVSTSDADGGTNVIEVTMTDGSTATFTVKNGSKGDTGEQGLQGIQGVQGEKGADGADGYTPVKGVDYFTEEDKEEIISEVTNEIPLVKSAQEPLFANGVSEMTDTSKVYVNTETGTFWVNKETTTVQEITEQLDEGYSYPENSRLGSDGTVQISGSYAGYTITPFIDLQVHPTPFKLHLNGAVFVATSSDNYTRVYTYDDSQTKVVGGNAILGQLDSFITIADSNVTQESDGNTTISFDSIPTAYGGAYIRYLRFSGKIFNTPNVFITYEAEVTGETWVDTGVSYGGSGADEELLNTVAVLNNEGSDPAIIKLLTKPVLDFYNSDDYSDDDYTTSYLEKVTYPCRADIPIPFNVKWNHNENAMRTTLVVDTKSIGTSNKYSMRIYDVTGFNNYPVYNLLPNTTYYYKVTHVLSDGSLVEAKSGSFTTSDETIRLIYIEGTQNVRDLGGWTGLDGKTVKYGNIFRGATLSDSTQNGLMLTGKGRLSLAELKVQAELNLGATDTETSIASNCDYTKIGYSNYATAITDEYSRGLFKTALEWIVDCLLNSRPIYIHCQGGCDRTGTLSFQLLGLLGVSESDLAKEYELSSFSDIGYGRLRTTTLEDNTYDYVGMVEAIKAYDGDTITDKFVTFAMDCGISTDNITQFRNLMLE